MVVQDQPGRHDCELEAEDRRYIASDGEGEHGHGVRTRDEHTAADSTIDKQRSRSRLTEEPPNSYREHSCGRGSLGN